VKPAIVLSGHTMALGVVRALGKMGVPITVFHYDERDMAHVSKYVTQKITTPPPDKFEEQFIDIIISHADHLAGGVIFPVSDETVVAVAKHKKRLEQHYTVACPEWEIVQKYIDKKYTYELGEEFGVPVPKTIIPKSVEDVKNYAVKVEYPCLVKPSQSHLFYSRFKKKMFKVESFDEMLDVYQQASESGLEVMLQEYIPGDDAQVYNYNSYSWDGKALVEFTSQHIRNAPPWTGSPRVALSQKIPELIEPGRKIIKALGFYGYACTEFKKDPRSGEYKLMEVNGRHNLSTLLAVHCGINFPWLEYRHLTEGVLPTSCDYKSGIYWIDIPRDTGYSAGYLLKERYSPMQYLKPYLKPHVFAIFDLKDPKPFIKRSLFLAKKAIQAIPSFLQRSKSKAV